MTIRNKFPGSCLKCAKRVEAGAGLAIKVDGRWSCYHTGCAPDGAADNATRPARNAAQVENVIEVRMDAGRVLLRPQSYLGPDAFERFRSATSGATYDREARVNRATVEAASAIVVRLAREGFKLDVAPEVTAAIQAQEAASRVKVTAAVERSVEVDARLRERGLSLFPFQAEGVPWLAARQGAVLADDMGLGKTIQALTAAPSGDPIVVVCPAVAKGVWLREAKRWRPDLRPVVLSGRGSFRWPLPGEMVVTNYDVLTPGTLRRDDLAKMKQTIERDPKNETAAEKLAQHEAALALVAACPKGVTLIADEAHVLKNLKTIRGNAFRTLSDAAFEHEGRVWLLTATPLLNRPAELWALLMLIRAEKQVFGSYQGYRRMMGMQSNGWGDTHDPRGIQTELVAPKLREVMLRRLKIEVLDQLPAKTVDVVEVDLDAASTKALDKIAEELAELGIDVNESIALAKANEAVVFEKMSAARAILAKAKTPHALAMAEELDDQGEPCVVFSAHRAPVQAAGAREGWALITGETANEERTRIEDAFQAGKLRGVAGTIKAAGVAITLTRAAHAIFVDSEWTPKLNEQAEDRIYRIGQARAVTVTYLLANHAIDRRVAELCSVKREMVRRSIDAARASAVNAPEALSASEAIAGSQASPASAAAKEAAAKEAAAKLAERVKRDRDAFDAARKRATSATKAERANANRGWNIPEELFLTPARAAASPDELWAARALVVLTAHDGDHAFHRNDVGFNASDTYLGHALAACTEALNEGEWQIAIKLCHKYQGQVGARPAA